MTWSPAVPDGDCRLCPRLAAFRDDNRRGHPDWHNGPVPSFGDLDAPLLIVGLAPGLRGANATGRPFTGDWAGDLLYETLLALGAATGRYQKQADDGLSLNGCRISNAVRCVPPANRPTPAEGRACRLFLAAEMVAMSNLRAILALGGFAHDSVLAARGGLRKADFPFAHGKNHELPDGLRLIDSYHCSRLNTNTGRLTADMFRQVAAAAIAAASSSKRREGSPGLE